MRNFQGIRPTSRLVSAAAERWRSTKARRVLGALIRIGWRVARQKGSHRILIRTGWSPVIFAFHDRATLGPPALARLTRATGLTPEDL